MVRITADIIRPVNDAWLTDYLGRHIRFSEMRRLNGEAIEVPADAPSLAQSADQRQDRGARASRAERHYHGPDLAPRRLACSARRDSMRRPGCCCAAAVGPTFLSAPPKRN